MAKHGRNNASDRPRHPFSDEPMRPKRSDPALVVVTALWFAGCLLFGAARTGDVTAALIGAAVVGWLGLPVVLVALVDVEADGRLGRGSLAWASGQILLWLALFAVTGSQTLGPLLILQNGLGLVACVLVPTWLVAATRSRRRQASPHRVGRRLTRSTLIPALAGCAALLGIIVTLIGASLWSDGLLVYATLSATLTTGLGFTWWIAHHRHPSSAIWLVGGGLLTGLVALDVTIGGLGPVGIVVEFLAFFGLLTLLAPPKSAVADRARSLTSSPVTTRR